MSIVKPDVLTDKEPEKRLTLKISKKSGRSRGKISIRHRGGGAKKRYRMVDFKMNEKLDIPAKVVSIEKDPYRNALIALLCYADGEKRYVLATAGMKVGSKVIANEKVPAEDGNRMKLKNIPIGTIISNIEIVPGKGGQLIRSAGSGASLQAIDKNMAQIKLSSGEIRLVSQECFATVGRVSNFEYSIMRVGKAGRKRHMGWRPTVRGTVMNPVDHPHGGGEGRQPIGLKHPKTPWGKPALGKKTRKKKKYSNRYIIKRRSK